MNRLLNKNQCSVRNITLTDSKHVVLGGLYAGGYTNRPLVFSHVHARSTHFLTDG